MTAITTTQPASTEAPRYALLRVLGIWAAAALPMGILGWIVAPALSPAIEVNPVGAIVARLGALTIGLIWLCILSLIVVYREEGDLRWTTIRRRLRLNTPRDPHTGAPRRKLWLWAIPLVLLIVLWQLFLGPRLTSLWTSLFPFRAKRVFPVSDPWAGAGVGIRSKRGSLTAKAQEPKSNLLAVLGRRVIHEVDRAASRYRPHESAHVPDARQPGGAHADQLCHHRPRPPRRAVVSLV
jgi:hypothetical protein